ncbi:hypothetical protein [Grimontia sp. NTOU-MAR1]|uniref:hypothetical protein n=1 Tax=Grimontia sp. NTOU-MAR1 TaxID=3111011 RepID=UPI002DB96591|nr:hypothetical protein [Grimontia sp. NTOU-MAR1]WRW00088.1 hypothetical protein VP504_24210 [Grimontia sp. NTOU-MAR1]
MDTEQKMQCDIYCRAESDRIRHVSTVELERFINLLHKAEPNDYKNWVFKLCKEIIDQHSDFPVRMPLFEDVIFPVIWEGCRRNELGCARWLAGFN